MNQEMENTPLPKPLRFAAPDYYQLMLERLEAQHLHPFDVHASIVIEGDHTTINVHFGEGLGRLHRTFAGSNGDELNASLVEYFDEVAAECKKTLINDYFKMMKV